MGKSKVWPATRQRVFERDGHCCRYCGRLCEPAASPVTRTMATLDHVVPRSRGGSSRADNLVTACFSCNAQKRRKTADEYAAWTVAKYDWEETRL